MHEPFEASTLRVVDTADGAVLSVRLAPRAAQTRIAGLHQGALLVRVAAPPVEGAANEALLATLAAVLRVPRTWLALLGGARGRDKRVRVSGLGEADVRARLAAHFSRPSRSR